MPEVNFARNSPQNLPIIKIKNEEIEEVYLQNKEGRVIEIKAFNNNVSTNEYF